MKTQLPPFSLSYTPDVPQIFNSLNCSVAISTYQAGKVILLSARDQDKLIQLPRTFDNAMGMAYSKQKLAIACKNSLLVLKNSPTNAPSYPAKPKTYDALFLPRCSYYTGNINLHDMAYINNKLIVVNTLFSCLSEINEEYSFQPFWKPDFISELKPEDRCHLNGMAILDEKIEYVTALGQTNSFGGWRENKIRGGILMHVPSGEVVLDSLSMPHSPRIYNDEIYFLNSAQGELCKADPEKRTYEVITHLGGFARGMSKLGDYLFIGVSRLRHSSDVFKDLPIAKTSFAGVVIVYLPYGNIVGQISYQTSVEEIYDVQVLPDLVRPGLLNAEREEGIMALVTPTDSYWAEYENKK